MLDTPRGLDIGKVRRLSGAQKAGRLHAPEMRFSIDRTFDEADRIGLLQRRPDVARDIKGD